MNFPIQIFQPFQWFSSKLFVGDANGALIGFVRQHRWPFRDKSWATIFADESQQNEIYSVRTERRLLSTGKYEIVDGRGQLVGALNHGWFCTRWRSNYVIRVDDHSDLQVEMDNFLKHFIANLYSMIPVISWMLKPSYRVSRNGHGEVLRMVLRHSFRGSTYCIAQSGQLTAREREAALVALTMIVLLDRWSPSG